jgi:hypothetical protein
VPSGTVAQPSYQPPWAVDRTIVWGATTMKRALEPDGDVSRTIRAVLEQDDRDLIVRKPDERR